MTLPAIQHRRVTESDRDTLLSMRKSCGWGSNRIDSYLSEPTWATYLFYRSSEDGQEQPVGMGCLVFDLPDDPAMASWETGTIAIGEHGTDATTTYDYSPRLVQQVSSSTRNHERPASATKYSPFSNVSP